MADKPTPGSPTTVAVTRHPKESSRQPLTAYRYYLLILLTRAGYRTWRRISRARTGRKDCHRPSRQERSGPGGREEERRELEGPAVPAFETAEPLDDFGLGAELFGVR
jgi:hypothetical protein